MPEAFSGVQTRQPRVKALFHFLHFRNFETSILDDPIPKKLLGAPGITTRNKDATRGSWPYYSEHCSLLGSYSKEDDPFVSVSSLLAGEVTSMSLTSLARPKVESCYRIQAYAAYGGHCNSQK